MISICCPFYPWTRIKDRTEEIFEVLIPSLNRVEQKDQIELVILHLGNRDIWGRGNRMHDIADFKDRIGDAWDGKIDDDDYIVERAATPVDIPNGKYTHYHATDDFVAGEDGIYQAWLYMILAGGDPLTSDKYIFEVLPHNK